MASAAAGYGVWYGEDDPRNMSTRVPLGVQSNQTGELMAVLTTVRNHEPTGDLRIISDSKYVIEGLTKNLRNWEQKGWLGVANGDIFSTIIARIQWRKGKTYLRWTKGHSGTAGNEAADKLAGQGARLPQPPDNDSLVAPPGEMSPGATLVKLDQRDFYRILRDKRKMPPRRSTTRNVEEVQDAIQEAFNTKPTRERVWLVTNH